MSSEKPQRHPPMRADDTDRMQMAQLLGKAAESGRLEVNEYEDRLARVYAAESRDELDRMSYEFSGSVLRPRPHSAKLPPPAPSTLLLSIMSGFERIGRWNVPKRLTTFSLWGGGFVDLRYADFTSADVEIRSYSIMGGQTILVPPEVTVDVRGRGVMGKFDHSATGTGAPGAPHVVIRGFSFWGRVGVKRTRRNRPEKGSAAPGT